LFELGIILQVDVHGLVIIDTILGLIVCNKLPSITLVIQSAILEAQQSYKLSLRLHVFI